MVSYTSEIGALQDISAAQTLAEAQHALRHNQGNAASVALAAHLDALEIAQPAANVGLAIVETAVGVWSGDAPAGRENGANQILFVPYDPADPTDPADATNGIATPANIRDWDLLGPVTVDSL